jgi:hypothetical protein
VEELSIEVDNL